MKDLPTPMKPAPPHWGADPISTHAQSFAENIWASFHHKKRPLNKFNEIEFIFEKLGKNLAEPKENLVTALCIIRAHSAFNCASLLAMGGHLGEVYALNRLCLEYAGYAALMKDNEEIQATFLKRHKDEISFLKQKGEFHAKNISAAVSLLDKQTGIIYDKIYQTSIDYGAHPNEKALTSNGALEIKNGQHIIKQKFLNCDDPYMGFAMKFTAQTAVCALDIFSKIFPARFSLLLLDDLLKSVKSGL